MKGRIQDLGRYLNKPHRAAYLFILPALLILFVFTVIPLIASLVMSLFRTDIFLESFTFIGFDNFMEMFRDDRFWNAMTNTIYYTVVQVPLQILVALIAAIFVAKNTIFRKMLRFSFFIPFICSLTAIGIVWSFLLDPQTGIITHYLTQIGLPRLAFFESTTLAMPTVILMSIWRNFGYSMIILMAGIQSIPESYYEAARIDGAGKVKQFFKITIPMVIPALSFCVIIQTIQAFQVFDQVFVTTQGGPLNSTDTMVNYIYNVGFAMAPYDLGYASALSAALLVFIMAVSLTMNRYFIRKEEDL